MKYLSDYTEEATTDLLESAGAFFAFSNKQFDEAKQEGVKYVSMGMGLICPKDKAEEVARKYPEIVKAGIAKDLQENGKEGVIKRELANHECYYTGEYEDAVKALEDYKITAEEVFAVYKQERELQNA